MMSDLQLILICASYFFCGLSFGITAYKPKTAFFLGVVALCCAIAHLEI